MIMPIGFISTQPGKHFFCLAVKTFIIYWSLTFLGKIFFYIFSFLLCVNKNTKRVVKKGIFLQSPFALPPEAASRPGLADRSPGEEPEAGGAGPGLEPSWAKAGTVLH